MAGRLQGSRRRRRDAWAACSAEVPRLLEQAERTALALAGMAREGFRLDDDTVERLAAAQARQNRWSRWALWVGALALVAIAVWLMLPAGLGPSSAQSKHAGVIPRRP